MLLYLFGTVGLKAARLIQHLSHNKAVDECCVFKLQLRLSLQLLLRHASTKGSGLLIEQLLIIAVVPLGATLKLAFIVL